MYILCQFCVPQISVNMHILCFLTSGSSKQQRALMCVDSEGNGGNDTKAVACDESKAPPISQDCEHEDESEKPQEVRTLCNIFAVSFFIDSAAWQAIAITGKLNFLTIGLSIEYSDCD